MFWLVCLFIFAVSYWMWVQKVESARVEEEVSRRQEIWQRDEEKRQREKQQSEREKYIELVQRRISGAKE